MLSKILLSFLIMISGSLYAAPKTIAAGTLKIPKSLEAKAKGIRTLYLIVYNPESKRPMPHGAQKVMLEKDAKGEFYKFNITTDSLRVMGGGSLPKLIKIKARLDKDGSAGMDQPGDIFGIKEGVKLTSTDNVIELSKTK